MKSLCKIRHPAMLLTVLCMAVAVSAGLDSHDDEPIDQTNNNPLAYVVHMAEWQRPSAFPTPRSWHESLINDTGGAILYDFSSATDGFAAKLTPKQALQLKHKPGVLGMHVQNSFNLHTTRSPAFMSLNTANGVWETYSQGEGVIVGIIDTGIYPDNPSFGDAGMDPPPRRWKGSCNTGEAHGFKCNNKIIGAKFFSDGIDDETDMSQLMVSPLDTEGHGSHTASTAVGSRVAGAGFFGYANGTASGMAPKAWLAVYKACWNSTCQGTDILAAIDAAVNDGVDIISLSLGGSSTPYYADSVNVAAFSAAFKDVLVVASAGNDGPDSGTISNVAPWVTTVAAGTEDRNFTTTLLTADGKRYMGSSLFAGGAGLKRPTNAPLVYNTDSALAAQCMGSALSPESVRGKIVVCDRGGNKRVAKGAVVKEAGGVGMILANTDPQDDEINADPHVLPAIHVPYTSARAIKSYISSAKDPRATIEEPETKLGVIPAPKVAEFSSRGPNSITREVLKPDVMAPGVNILAAWTNATSPSKLPSDGRHVSYNIISGTSMSCPHVAGVAALLQGEHPEWSPAAIRSALITTANPKGNDRNWITDSHGFASPYARGAGHIMPHRAMRPGLIYDIDAEEYYRFICSLNYTNAQVKTIVRTDFNCGSIRALDNPGDLNYPSFSVVFTPSRRRVVYKRIVTNVGEARSTYRAKVFAPRDMVKVRVSPTVLEFTRSGEKIAFNVTFAAVRDSDSDFSGVFGSLVWTNGKVAVRSPMAFTFSDSDA